MQYLHEIGNKVSSIEDFLKLYDHLYLKNIFNVEYKDTCVYTNIPKNIELMKDNNYNIPYVLPDGSCILILREKQTNEFYDVIYNIIFKDTYEIYRIDRNDNTFSTHKIETTDKKYDDIRLKIIISIFVRYIIIKLIKNQVKDRIGDRTNYLDGTYYIGDYNKNIRNGYGTFVSENEFVLSSNWDVNGLPIRSYLTLYIDDKRLNTYVNFNYNDNTHPAQIIFPINHYFHEANQHRNKKGKIIYTTPSDKVLIFLCENIIIVGRYIIFFDNFEIVDRSTLIEDYMFDKKGEFIWLKINYNDKIIIMDTNIMFYIIAKPYFTIHMRFIYDNNSLNLILSYNINCFNYKYNMYNDNETVFNGCMYNENIVICNGGIHKELIENNGKLNIHVTNTGINISYYNKSSISDNIVFICRQGYIYISRQYYVNTLLKSSELNSVIEKKFTIYSQYNTFNPTFEPKLIC